MLHIVCTRRNAPISIIDALITANPNALLQQDASGGRLPLHVATLKGAPSETIQHLIRARPQALGMPDQERNLPIHYAAQYSSSTLIFKRLLTAHPQGASVSNAKGRFPLYLLCTHCFDLHVTPQELQDCYNVYPHAIQSLDRYGRTPLHLACQAHPRWDLLQVLMEHYPEGLTVKDKSGKVPYELAQCHFPHNQRDVVLSGLSDATVRERRKKRNFMPLFTSRTNRKRKKKINVDLFGSCYG
jgi:ankyrin repeat protein